MSLRILGLKLTDVLWICLIGALTIRALYRRWKYRGVYAFMESLPGPIALPFIGASYLMMGISRENIIGKQRAFVKKYPVIAQFWEREDAYLVTSSREVFNAILSSNENIDKLSHFDDFKIACSSMFSARGNEWRMIRKIVNPSFRSNVLATFDVNFSHHVKIFVNQLEQHIHGDKFDVFAPVHRCNIDLINDNMIGVRTDTQEDPLDLISSAMEQTVEMILERAFSILLWPDFIYTLSGKRELLNALIAEQRNFVQKMVEQRIRVRNALKETNQHSEHSQIFMDILLENLETGTLTKEHIISEVFEMLVAGSVTTAIANAWVFKLLAMYPDIQERAYQEIKESSAGEEVKMDDTSKLVYLEMVVKETLRHFGIIVTGRKINVDVQVNDKLTIPRGIEVLMCVYDLHHDPQYWQKPGEFYPEHFSSTNENSRPKGTFIPFLSGPRICPGNRYGMKSMKFLIANTLLRYKFTTDEQPPQDLRDLNHRYVFLLYPTSGFRVKIDRR